MSVGIVMLVHTALERAEQVARQWARGGCPVVIHVDRKVPRDAHDAFVSRLRDEQAVEFSRRHHCEWGSWGLVAASQDAAELMLEKFDSVHHVYLTSGSCLPLRPVDELVDYLHARPRTDFIESATTSDVPWTVGGLEHERFTLRFPFSWRKNRYLFDKFVEIQRAIGYRRKIPRGIEPHMGSQWWCLTRQTLSAVLQDPQRPLYDAYFRRVWIPDESYFQTLSRKYSTNIESRSLTLSKFDFQGKPHIFYDDHLQLLRRSDCFVARKIWPYADKLYEAFLTDPNRAMSRQEPNPGKIDRIFAKAVERRTRGRAGLYMQSRFPNVGWENGFSAGKYSVFQGFDELFDGFQPWLARASGAQVHGRLFGPERAEFADGQEMISGAVCDNAKLRDANPKAFLTNVLWNMRGERQCFQFSPSDNTDIVWDLARDANAQISVISGAWAVPLFKSNSNFADLRAIAARLQKNENYILTELRSPDVKARVRVWTMAEFLQSPMEFLHQVIGEMGHSPPTGPIEAARIEDLTGFGQFLQNLKNQGMHPYLMGDFPVDRAPQNTPSQTRKPYLIKQ